MLQLQKVMFLCALWEVKETIDNDELIETFYWDSSNIFLAFFCPGSNAKTFISIIYSLI